MDQTHARRSLVLMLFVLGQLACGDGGGALIDRRSNAETEASDGGGGRGDASAPVLAGEGTTETTPSTCDAPDVLVVLDRTLSMAATPQGGRAVDVTQSKWELAIAALVPGPGGTTTSATSQRGFVAR